MRPRIRKTNIRQLPPPDTAEVLAARAEGLSYPQIAARFKATKNAVVVICRNAGLVSARDDFPDDRNMTPRERKDACAAHLADLREHHSERLAA